VILGFVLLTAVRRPARVTGLEAVHGHRVFGTLHARAVREISVTFAARRFVASPHADGWDVDGRRAEPTTADALTDLREALVRLRAVDVFRPRDGAAYGLDHPRATIVLRTARGERRLALGDLNAVGSTVYARREGDPRVLQVGTLVLSQLERVFFHRDHPPAGDPGAHAPP